MRERVRKTKERGKTSERRKERERKCRCEVRSAFKKPSEASLKFPGLKKKENAPSSSSASLKKLEEFKASTAVSQLSPSLSLLSLILRFVLSLPPPSPSLSLLLSLSFSDSFSQALSSAKSKKPKEI